MRLPDDAAGRGVESGPGAAGDRVARRELVRLFRVMADRRVDPPAVVRRSPLNPAGIRARADEAAPQQRAGARIQRPIDAALLANANHIAGTPAANDPEHVGAGAGEVPDAE